ncbi:MAG: beta-glucosidase [Deltaproteobacteria bacterium]|nr:beta-glucosidase [Deltaproteobacteria bacterium]
MRQSLKANWGHLIHAVNLVGALSLATVAQGQPSYPRTADEVHVDRIINRLSLSEKIGQMIQAQIINLQDEMAHGRRPIKELNLGSILAGGDSIIADNTPAGWRTFFATMQAEAKASSSGLPMLIGVDAVHGHGIVRGATLFPHNIGLGAARSPELIQGVGAAVAREVLATGFNWNFAPGVIVARDIRWGRTYESFGQNPELQELLAGPFTRGLQETPLGGLYMVGSAKHFLGDGGATWGTGMPSVINGKPQIDRGDTSGDLAAIKALHVKGYEQAIDAGVDTVMASYSSVNGVRMHANKALLTDYLKADKAADGLGFTGFVISDWNAVDELDVGTPDNPIDNPIARYKAQLVTSVNAGVDMIMVFGKLDFGAGREDREYRYRRVHQLLTEAVEQGLITEQRINDAVSRILRIKSRIGLLDGERASANLTVNDTSLDQLFGAKEHRQLARTAVRASMVLLKNDAATLPIDTSKYKRICVAGSKANDFGTQAGAWTVGWQGQVGNANKTAGASTILDGIKSLAAARGLEVIYAEDGKFSREVCKNDALVIAVIGEKPYAEYYGDAPNLSLSNEDQQLLENAKSNQAPLAVVLLSGRPLIITNELPSWQAFVAAWLPGSQGEGVADVLFGDFNFSGKLPLPWPRDMSQIPMKEGMVPLFPYGTGLSYGNGSDPVPTGAS